MLRKSRQRRTRKRLSSLRSKSKKSRVHRKQRGAGYVPFPDESVVITKLNPEDPEEPFVAVSKKVAEEEIFN
jgi:hypothetical protein